MLPGSLPYTAQRIAQERRALADEHMARMIERASLHQLPTLLAFCIDEGMWDLEQAQVVLNEKFAPDDAPPLASILEAYTAPWWAPWRKNSVCAALRAWRAQKKT